MTAGAGSTPWRITLGNATGAAATATPPSATGRTGGSGTLAIATCAGAGAGAAVGACATTGATGMGLPPISTGRRGGRTSIAATCTGVPIVVSPFGRLRSARAIMPSARRWAGVSIAPASFLSCVVTRATRVRARGVMTAPASSSSSPMPKSRSKKPRDLRGISALATWIDESPRASISARASS